MIEREGQMALPFYLSELHVTAMYMAFRNQPKNCDILKKITNLEYPFSSLDKKTFTDLRRFSQYGPQTGFQALNTYKLLPKCKKAIWTVFC